MGSVMGVNSPDPVVIQAFLHELYDGADAGYLAIFDGRTKLTTWVSVRDLDVAALTIARLSQSRDIYFGIGLHPAPLGPHSRGAASMVSVVPGLHVDIDIAGGVHAQQALPQSVRDVANLLRAAVPLMPSLVNHSGGGAHCYWLFREPWILESDEERRRAAQLNSALQIAIIAEAKRRGWEIESTADLARVFRPAGSLNHKRPDAPVLVRTIHNGGERYSIDTLEYYLPSEQAVFRSRPEGSMPKHAPIALWGHIVGKCPYLRHCVDDAATLDEPSWHAEMSIVARCRGGDQIAHQVSQNYARYDRSETDKKFAYSLKADAPLRCSTIRYHRGGESWCSQCVHWGTIASPIVLGLPRGYIIRPSTANAKGATRA